MNIGGGVLPKNSADVLVRLWVKWYKNILEILAKDASKVVVCG